MNSVVNDNIDILGEIQFRTKDEVLEGHQIMINQLRTNVIVLGNQTTQLYKLVEKLYDKLEEE